MKTTCYIMAQYSPYDKSVSYSCWTHDMTEQGYVLIEKRELEFETIPKNVIINKTVEAYRNEQKKLRADMQIKVDNLEEVIQSMLSLEFKPE